MTRFVVLAALWAAACGGHSSRSVTPPGPVATEPVAEATPAPPPSAPPAPTAPPAAPKTLYERLGGTPAITAVVDSFVTRTTSDPRIKERFFNTDAVQLKRLLVEFVCSATGGPCKYTGRDMHETHASMELVDAEFDALVENLVAALDEFHVPAAEKGEVLGALGPLRPQMVAPAGTLKPLAAAKLAQVTTLAAKQKDPAARSLLELAVVAGQRGQRSYAEQLFSRAELVTGPAATRSVAAVFREGAPPRIDTKLQTAKDSAPQPMIVGTTEEDAGPVEKVAAELTGKLKLGGNPVATIGVVMLTPAKKAKGRTPKTRVIEQRDKMFAPHILAVPVGSTVQFPNFDTVYHNVFSVSKVKSFDLGLYKNGQLREITFTKPGVIRLGCNIHASMSAYVVVVDAPHYVVVDKSGSFAFKNLAPGKYKLQAWSEQSGAPLSADIEITAGSNTRDIDLQAGAIVAPTDKFGTKLVVH